MQLMGGVLSGGTSVDDIVTWSTEPARIYIATTGQAWIGGRTVDINNQPVEIGGRLQTLDRIDIIGGTHVATADGVGVLLPARPTFPRMHRTARSTSFPPRMRW